MRVVKQLCWMLALAGCTQVPAGTDAGDGGGAGVAGDAAVSTDAAVERDAASPPDAGTGRDAAMTVMDAAVAVDAAGAQDAGVVDAATADAAVAADAGNSDAGTLPACQPPSGLGRGALYTRTHPLFVSALSVAMGPPSATAVNDYFDAFHATGVHLWANGMPTEIEGWAAGNRPDLAWVSWTQSDGTSVANGQVLGGPTHPAGRIAYQIGDEPLDMAQLMTMYGGVTAVRAADPDALIVLNFADIEGLDVLLESARMNADVDVFSYDRYNYSKDHYKVIGMIRQAAVDSGKQYWRYMDAYRDASQTDDATLEDMRWDAMVGAAYGYTGYTWFVYNIEPNNPDLVPLFFDVKGDYASPRTQRFEWAATINQQLQHVGRSLSLLRSVDVRYYTPVALLRPEGTTGWTRGAGNHPYLSAVGNVPTNTWRDAVLGFFRDDCDEPYVFVLNVSHNQANFPNATDQPGTFRLDFDFTSASDATLDRTALMVLRPEGGEPMPVPLIADGANAAHVELTIPAGGGVLFKHKNARPFVRR